MKLDKPVTSGLVDEVDPCSRAHAAGLRPGDRIVAIDGMPVLDVLDVLWAAQEGLLDLTVERSGSRLEITIELDEGQGLGFTLAAELFDGVRRCANRCVFCFVDQQPPGLRKSLYVKDEDYRASFLHGNFITMTRLDDDDLDRIVDMHLSPLYVSVHATDEAVRRRLMGRRDTRPLLPLLDELAASGIEFHTQIVIVPGYNDGEVLERSLRELVERHPAVLSVAVVPVGLTRHRDGLASLRPLGPGEAAAVLDTVETFQARCRDRFGRGIVYGADELYLKSGTEIPPAPYYDDFPLLENGVGMLRRFLDGVERAVEESARSRPGDAPAAARKASILLATGTAAASFFTGTVLPLLSGPPFPRVEVLPVVNRLFGDSVTVAGLLCGADLAAALRERLGEPNSSRRKRGGEGARPGKDGFDRLLLCENLFKGAAADTDRDELVFLDDLGVDEAAAGFGLSVKVLPDDGEAFVRHLLGLGQGKP